MLIHVTAAKCIGIDAVKVMVEIDIDRGIGIHLVGLADVAVKESLLRTSTALEALGFKIPGKRIVINLAPADLHKNGSGYDLPIAIGIIAASGQMELPGITKHLILGELGLDGSVRDIPGALPYAELAARNNLDVILPAGSALEAAEFKNTRVYGVASLTDVTRILSGKGNCADLLVRNNPVYLKSCGKERGKRLGEIIDFQDIIGQEGAKRGAEIAVCGGHNLIMIGSPGSGKSSLAKAMAGILPPMTDEEALLTSKIYSIAGRGESSPGLIRERPFRSPHYSASLPAIVGGGGGDSITPGEVTLACNGILFLDEIGQMPRTVIESLRGPMEDRTVTISRLRAKITFPASFMLVAASNPCPCGYWGEKDRCTCTPAQRANYLTKLSGPIMDRIDIQMIVHSIPPGKMMQSRITESSVVIAERVRRAREIQTERFRGESLTTNAEMTNKQLEKYCHLDGECRKTMEDLMERMGFSMRAWFRIIKVARTIADMDESKEIKPQHLIEAASFRFLDRNNIFL